MAEVKTWLAGFTYRGRAPWETQAPDYHVEIGEYAEIEGRDPIQLGTKVLTPDAAKAAGYTLPATLKAINGDALSEVEALRSETVALKEAKAGVDGLLEEANAARDKERAERERSAATITDLQKALKAARTDVERMAKRIAELEATSTKADVEA